MILGLAAGLLGAALFGVGAVVQAHAVRRLDHAPDRLAGFVATGVRDPWTMLVVLMYLAGFVLHAVAIWLLPLYLAQATVAMSLPVTAVTSLVLHERLTPVHWSALVVVTLGLVLLSLGAGRPGGVIVTPAFALTLAAGVAVLAVVARRCSALGGGLLGLVAGLGYSGSALAVRGVEASLDPWVVVAALAVPTYSIVAFWMYSLGMDRSPVSSVTAPLIVAQTFVPALVGVWLLGDQVRDGWWPAVVAGLLLATTGAVLLSRDEVGPVRSPDGPATSSAPDPARRPAPAPRRSPSSPTARGPRRRP
jgi:drug/metabolite transporter (DMT)-like permease